jgi:hypothetical protein
MAASGFSRAAALALVALAACTDREPTTGPIGNDYPAHPGFDISIYPGDAALAAWKSPASPYEWVGYYLLAPCHRTDSSWVGRRAQLAAAGWGIAVLYVGQQDWRYIPIVLDAPTSVRAGARVDRPTIGESVDTDATGTPESIPTGASGTIAAAVALTCSSQLLTADQGTLEGVDAAEKTARDGFALGSTIYLDVEHVTTVDPALAEYVRAWVASVLRDGRYRAGIYMSRSNATAIHDAAVAGYRDVGRLDSPSFWVAASTASLGFSLGSLPSDVGFDYVSVWQGALNVVDEWNGVRLTIDRNVASTASPSAPLLLASHGDP